MLVPYFIGKGKNYYEMRLDLDGSSTMIKIGDIQQLTNHNKAKQMDPKS